MRVVLAQPRGFCAGVERAIEIVERALEKYGPPIYVRHEIVHNRHVVERLRAKGARFVDELGRNPARQRHHLQRPRRRQRGRGRCRGARPAGDRRDLPAGLQGPQRGPALCRAGPRDRADRPCRPSRGRRHDGPDRRQGPSHLEGRGGRQRSRSAIPDKLAYITQTTLVGRRHPGGHRGAARALSRPSSGPTPRTSATPPRTASAPCANWRMQVDVVLVVGRRQQLQLEPAAGRSRPSRACRPISSPMPTRSIPPGSRARNRSASPPAPRRPRSWCRS